VKGNKIFFTQQRSLTLTQTLDSMEINETNHATTKGSVKHQMRTRSIQGTNTIFNQNKPKISNLTKCSKMQQTNKPLKFTKILELDIKEISST
jgi:hypothetical protein